MTKRRALPALLLAAAALPAAACGRSAGARPALTEAPAAPTAAAGARGPAVTLAAQVGREMFFDQRLSASGRMSCATCHDPDHAYGPPNDLAVQLGGP
jgi:cytochrome c peroxidase